MQSFKQFLAEEKKNRSDAGALHAHLKASGFSHDKSSVEDSHRRYIKRGFRDGDFPNAHRTKVHTEGHVFSKEDVEGAHHKALHKHLVSSGFKHSKTHTSYSGLAKGKLKKKINRHSYTKGKNHVVAHTYKGILHVHHTFESTKPDHDYFVAGQVA